MKAITDALVVQTEADAFFVDVLQKTLAQPPTRLQRLRDEADTLAHALLALEEEMKHLRQSHLRLQTQLHAVVAACIALTRTEQQEGARHESVSQ